MLLGKEKIPPLLKKKKKRSVRETECESGIHFLSTQEIGRREGTAQILFSQRNHSQKTLLEQGTGTTHPSSAP